MLLLKLYAIMKYSVSGRLSSLLLRTIGPAKIDLSPEHWKLNLYYNTVIKKV